MSDGAVETVTVHNHARRCPYCHAIATASEQVCVCNQCLAVVHEDCWLEANACPSCDCTERLVKEQGPSRQQRARIDSDMPVRSVERQLNFTVTELIQRLRELSHHPNYRNVHHESFTQDLIAEQRRRLRYQLPPGTKKNLAICAVIVVIAIILSLILQSSIPFLLASVVSIFVYIWLEKLSALEFTIRLADGEYFIVPAIVESAQRQVSGYFELTVILDNGSPGSGVVFTDREEVSAFQQRCKVQLDRHYGSHFEIGECIVFVLSAGEVISLKSIPLSEQI